MKSKAVAEVGGTQAWALRLLPIFLLGALGGFCQALLQGRFYLAKLHDGPEGRSLTFGSWQHVVLGGIAAVIYSALVPSEAMSTQIANMILAGLGGGSLLTRHAVAVGRAQAVAVERAKNEVLSNALLEKVGDQQLEKAGGEGGE